MSDHFRIDIIDDYEDQLRRAIELAYNHNGWGPTKASGYSIEDDKLILYWSSPGEGKGYVPFAVPHDAEMTANIVWAWLQTSEPTEAYPDLDGSVKKGFRVYNEKWGHVNGTSYAIVGIQAVYTEYGK